MRGRTVQQAAKESWWREEREQGGGGRARGECVRKGRSLETSRRAAVLRTVRAAVDRSGCPREEYVGRRNV